MTTSNQKNTELEQLESFLRFLGIKDYQLIDKKNESPDFILMIEGEKIGVEVTEIYRKYTNGNSAKVESDLPKIVEGAVRLYNEKKGLPCSFGVGFYGEKAVTRKKDVIKELGEFLYQLSVDNLNINDSEIKEIKPDINKFPLLSIVSSIHVKKINNTVSSGFTTSIFGAVNMEGNELRGTIESKAKKINKYKERCETIWLLIVLPSMVLSGDFCLSNYDVNIDNNGFDAVYILDQYREQIKCVKQA